MQRRPGLESRTPPCLWEAFEEATPDMALGMFVTMVYLPFYGRKWKRSTMMSNHDRLERYLVLEFGTRKLGSFRREELQDFLDRREADGTVAHLRWDMRQIFRMAVAEGFPRGPANQLIQNRSGDGRCHIYG
jgi:hypothetical protein